MVNDVSHGLIEGNRDAFYPWALEKTINHVEEALHIHQEYVQKVWKHALEHGQN